MLRARRAYHSTKSSYTERSTRMRLPARSPASLLATYSAERQVIAQNLIDFDREWATMMAKKPEEFDSPEELAEFYVTTAEFPAGFMTQYEPSMIIGEATHQDLATGFP